LKYNIELCEKTTLLFLKTIPIYSSYLKEIHKGEVELTMLDFKEISDLDTTFLYTTEQEDLSQLKSKKRRREFFAIRAIRNKKGIPFPISYNTIGAPFFEGTPLKLSISHSHEIAVLATAPFNIGVDLEPITERIIRLKKRFATSTEISFFKFTEAKTLTIIWTIKEVLYKLAGNETINLLSEMNIIELENDLATCQFKTELGDRFVKIKFQEISNFIISFNPSKYYENDILH
jgi:4'-phosphopantetheinyl transferase